MCKDDGRVDAGHGSICRAKAIYKWQKRTRKQIIYNSPRNVKYRMPVPQSQIALRQVQHHLIPHPPTSTLGSTKEKTLWAPRTKLV